MVVFLVAVSTIYFLVEAAWPGDGAELLCGTDCTPEQVDVLRAQRGLDNDSVIAGYGRWLGDLASLDLSRSLVTQDVAESLKARWEPTIELAVTAELAAVGLVLAGTSLTRRRETSRRSARVATTLAALAWSVPSYALAVILVRELSFRREWLPATGWTFVGEGLTDHVRNAAIPFMAVLVPSVGFWAWLILRDRGRGIRADVAIVARVFPVALTWAFSAVMVIERLLAVPGLGLLLLTTQQPGDEPTVRGVLAVLAAVACVAGFLGFVVAGLIEWPTSPGARIGWSGATAPIEVDGPDGDGRGIPGESGPEGERGRGRRARDPWRWAWRPARGIAVVVLALLLVAAAIAGWQPRPWLSRVVGLPESARPDGQLIEEWRMVAHGARRVVRIALPVAAAVTVLMVGLASARRLRRRGLDLVLETVIAGIGMVGALGLGALAASTVLLRPSWPRPWPDVVWVAATTVVPGYLWWRARLADHRPDLRGAAVVFLRVSAVAVFTLGTFEFLSGDVAGWGGTLRIAGTFGWEDDSYLWLAVLAITLTCFSLRVLADWLDPGPRNNGDLARAEAAQADADAAAITVFGEAVPVGAR